MKFSLISVLFISVIALPMDSSVEGQFQQSASILQGKKKSRLFIKVKTLWEGHKIGKNLPPVLTKQLFLLNSVKTSGRFFFKFLWPSQKSWSTNPPHLWSKSINLKMACACRNFKNFFLNHFSSPFYDKNIYFRSIFHFDNVIHF